MTRRSSRGWSLVELLVGLLLSMVVGAGLIKYLETTYFSRAAIMGTNEAVAAGRTPIDTLADHLRNAQGYPANGTPQYAIQDARPTSVTYYATSGGQTARYYLENGELKRTDSSGTATVMRNITFLQFDYFLSNASDKNYYSDQLYLPSNPAALTDAERARIAAVQITVRAQVEGYVRTFSSIVRLRNSPKKTGI